MEFDCQPGDDHGDYDGWDDEFPDGEAQCHTCQGEGMVESIVAETRRWLCDRDEPGTCPNCRGSGLKKDCGYF